MMQGTTGNAVHTAERLMAIEREHDELRSQLEILKNQVHHFKKCRQRLLVRLELKASLCSLIFLSDELQAPAVVPEQFVASLLEIEKERDELRSQLKTTENQVQAHDHRKRRVAVLSLMFLPDERQSTAGMCLVLLVISSYDAGNSGKRDTYRWASDGDREGTRWAAKSVGNSERSGAPCLVVQAQNDQFEWNIL
jgi:hypothetical protein